MGCCQSRDAGDYESPRASVQRPAEAAIPNTSSRPGANQSSRLDSQLPSNAASSNTRPNQPIRTPTPVPKSPAKVSNQLPPWTRKHLERERDAFFDTRVSGNSELWRALRVVCEMVRKGDLAEAQGIMNALNVTCPTGRIARDRGKHKERGGVFDERGTLYEIPAWVVTDPQDIIEDQEKDDDVDESDDEQDESGVTASLRKEEKGKGRAEDPGEIVSLRARLSNTGTDVTVSVGTKQRISEIVREIQQQIGSRRMRLMYLGQTLDERSTLEQVGWKQGHVVNALVFDGDEDAISKRPG